MHDHSKCQHELKYCEKCDVVYCEKCNKEWKQVHSSWTPISPYSQGTGTLPIQPDVFYCSSNPINHNYVD